MHWTLLLLLIGWALNELDRQHAVRQQRDDDARERQLHPPREWPECEHDHIEQGQKPHYVGSTVAGQGPILAEDRRPKHLRRSQSE